MSDRYEHEGEEEEGEEVIFTPKDTQTNNAPVSETSSRSGSEEDDSDDDTGDLILLARISNVKLKGESQESQQARAQRERQKRQQQTAEEKARAERKKEFQAQAEEKKEKHRKSKAEKRLAFTVESLKTADSHVAHIQANKPRPAEPEATAASGTLKELLADGYRLSQENKSREAIPVLKQALQLSLAQNNLAVALSSSSLLGNEHLNMEQTRDAIDCFHRAIQLAKQVGVTIEQRQSLLAALQNAYKNVGDSESAKEVPIMYGPAFFASSGAGVGAGAGPAATVSDKTKELTAELRTAVDSALEQALLNKDLQPLKTLIASFAKSPFAASLVRHAHPHTGVTCLHVAAGRDDADLVNTAVAFGANVSAKDNSGSSPILWAARFGGTRALEALINAGAKFDEDLSEKEISSWPPAVKQIVAQMVS